MQDNSNRKNSQGISFHLRQIMKHFGFIANDVEKWERNFNFEGMGSAETIIEAEFMEVKSNPKNEWKGFDEEMKLRFGSITYRKREDRYQGVFYYNGEKIYSYDRDKKKCQKKMEEKLKSLIKDEENKTIGKNMKFFTWVDYWWGTYKKNCLKESSIINTQFYIDLIKKNLGEIAINKINEKDILVFINQLENENQKTRCHMYVREIIDKAFNFGFIKTNFASMIKIKKEGKKITKVNANKILSIADERKIMDYLAVNKRDLYLLSTFAIKTGLRIGELGALTWRDVNFDNNFINVNKQFSKTTKKIETLKTKKSKRIIPLFDEARTVLEEMGIKNDASLIFNNFNFMSFSPLLAFYSKKCNLHITPHVLRHTFATRCFEKGIDIKTVQMWLGHENYNTTADIYIHNNSFDIVSLNKMNKKNDI